MGRLRGRLARLEERYGVGTGQFAPHEGEERVVVAREAIRRLTSVELAVLEDLMALRERHPDLSGASFFSLMTDVHHVFEREWVKVVRGVLRDKIEATDATRERKAELQKRADDAISMGELPDLGEYANSTTKGNS